MDKPIVSKSKNCKYNIELDYQSPDLESGETISSVDVAAYPSGLSLGTPGITSDQKGVLVEISGGLAGKIYMVLFEVTTSSGKIFNDPDYDAVLVKIKPIKKGEQ